MLCGGGARRGWKCVGDVVVDGPTCSCLQLGCSVHVSYHPILSESRPETLGANSYEIFLTDVPELIRSIKVCVEEYGTAEFDLYRRLFLS